MFSLIKDTKISIQALKSADNESLTGATLDMLGYDSVAFIAGALAGEALDFTIKAAQGAASDLSDAADLEGTSITFATTTTVNGLTTLEVHQPRERYVRAVVAVPNAAAATPTFCIAIQFNMGIKPYATNAGELHVSPAEGTA